MSTSDLPPNSGVTAEDARPPEDSPNLTNLTPEEHRQRHVELHRAMDELYADYIMHHPLDHGLLRLTIHQLMEWSYRQTQHADEPPVTGLL